MKLSIIIVNFKSEKEVINCLKSIEDKVVGLSFEVIIVDNDSDLLLEKKIKNYKFAKYFKTPSNLGYGGGNNFGAAFANGEFLFILNPDTKIAFGSIRKLISKFSNKRVGIIAPELLDKNGNNLENQGSRRLTPVSAIFSTSVIHKVWPNNPIAHKYYLNDVKRSGFYEVNVVPGTAFLIQRKLFEKIGGFDEKFFLYFEEDDLCNRVSDSGYKILMTPLLKVVHLRGVSTAQLQKRDQIFKESRFYYFKKYYGLIPAYLSTWFLDISLNTFILFIIIASGVFLRFYNLSKQMIFISDQAWFYISARDMIFSGKIPLVGITSSQIWLHQGPIWTYLLAPGLLISNFNPISGAYLSILFDLATILILYITGSRFLSKSTGMMAALLYATSPLTIILSRMPYHTSPIPFFVALLVFSVCNWISGKAWHFALTLFILSSLYNFELATVVLWFPVLFIAVYGFLSKQKWATKLLNIKTILVNLLCFILPLIPICIYDVGHGFVQTAKYANWVISLKIIKPFITLNFTQVEMPSGISKLFEVNLQRIIFLPSVFVSDILFLLAFLVLTWSCFFNAKKVYSANAVILILFLIPAVGFLFNGVASDAYMPVLFPTVIMIVSYFVAKTFKRSNILGFIFISILILPNIYFLLNNNYLTGSGRPYGPSISNIKNQIKNQKVFDSKLLNFRYIKWEMDRDKKYVKVFKK